MAEKTRYELKGTLREDCMKDTATLDGFRPLDSDWRELLRWLMSVSGDLPYYDTTDKKNGSLSALWENHVLTVLVDILQKNVEGYVDSFTEGYGTFAQTEYTDDLKEKFGRWTHCLKEYINRSRSIVTGNIAVEVAEELLEQLEKALPQNTGSGPKYLSNLLNGTNQPYYSMLGTVADIQQKGDGYIARIESSGDLDASLALLLTFVRSYCGIVERFNGRFWNWAEFYRKNILHDTPREAVQDSTYIVIVSYKEKSAETFPLPKGTEFAAEKRSEGSDLCYATTEKAYIIPAHIHAAYSLFSKDNRLHIAPVSGKEPESIHPLFDTANPVATVLEYGWLLTSRSLTLSEGRRTVTVRLYLNTEEGDPMPDLSALAGDASCFILQLSDSEGWMQAAYTSDYDHDTRSLQFIITLNEGEETPAVCIEELHGIVTEYPALRILFADRLLLDTLPQTLHIEEIGIATEVEGIRNFTLIGESGPIDASQPFYPFGPMGERDSRLIFGHEEAALKNITAVTLKGAWMKLPENGFAPIYKNYNTEKTVDEDSFMVRCEWQENSSWHECADSPLPLFNKNENGKLSGEAVFELVLTDKTVMSSFMPYCRDSNGFFRLTLTTPDMGFGMKTYYRLFSEVMMYNGREKEKNWKSVPEQPQVPILCDVTFGYRSEEVIRSGDGSLYNFTGILGDEKCMQAKDEYPSFLPVMEFPSLWVELDNMGDTNRVRLYLDLRYAVQGWQPVKAQPDYTLIISRYLRNGIWQRLSAEDVLCEETSGLTRSGFIEIKVPETEKENGLWLKLSFTNGDAPESIILDGIYLNCLRVTAEGGDGNSLPVGTMKASALEDDRILSVSQPMPGSGGKPTETEADAGIRQRIRISARNRAICSGNYEYMILERFPDIEKACCVPSTVNGDEVCIVVFPKPEKQKYPFLPAWKLAEIEAYVKRYASPFAKICVLNPVYEPLSISFKAVLKEDTRAPGTIKRRTERRIRIFFMSWYIDGKLPDLDVQYSCDALLSRITNDECIEDFISLNIAVGGKLWRITGECGESDRIFSAASACGILYIEKLNVELVDNRSGVDEARIGTDFVIR